MAAKHTVVNIHAQHYKYIAQGTQSVPLDAKLRRTLLDVLVDPELEPQTDNDFSKNKLRATLTVAVGSRVALMSHMAPELGLVKGATGTVLGFVYDGSDEAPCDPSLSPDGAAKCELQPQLPVVIVNMDSRWYTGVSAGPKLRHLLPGFDGQGRAPELTYHQGGQKAHQAGAPYAACRALEGTPGFLF